MSIKITSKKDLVNFFAKIVVTEKFTNMAELGLEFGEDDFIQCNECDLVEEPTKFFMLEKMTDTSKGKFVCAGCKEDLLLPERRCSGCDKRIKHLDNPTRIRYFLNGEEHDGEVCRECSERRRYHKTYTTCIVCQNFEAAERMGEADGIIVCRNCIQRNYYYCQHCDEHHRNRDRGDGRVAIPRPNVARVDLVPLEALIEAEHAGIAAVV